MGHDALLSAPLSIAGLTERFFALLSAIEATGSINQAARTAGLSYKGAWLMLEHAGNLAQTPLLLRAVGGSRGGGTELTPMARELLAAWHRLADQHRAFLSEQEVQLRQHEVLGAFLGRMRMKSTARNQFVGKVSSILAGPVTTRVNLSLKDGDEIVAAVTAEEVKRLKLKRGVEAIALVKASNVVLLTESGGYRFSDQNRLAGTVSRIEKGAVSSLVVMTLAGGASVSATVTKEAVEALALRVGQPASAMFRPYAVILGVKE